MCLVIRRAWFCVVFGGIIVVVLCCMFMDWRRILSIGWRLWFRYVLIVVWCCHSVCHCCVVAFIVVVWNWLLDVRCCWHRHWRYRCWLCLSWKSRLLWFLHWMFKLSNDVMCRFASVFGRFCCLYFCYVVLASHLMLLTFFVVILIAFVWFDLRVSVFICLFDVFCPSFRCSFMSLLAHWFRAHVWVSARALGWSF